MKALVTGATGLLGGVLVDTLLSKGWQVRALARKTSDVSHLKSTNATLVYGDVSDPMSLPPAVEGVDVVFHSAGRVTPGWGEWKDFEDATVNGTKNLLQAACDAKVPKFLHVSSHSVLGKSALSNRPADESAPCQLTFCRDAYYDYAKKLAEDAVLEYHKAGKIRASIIRPAMIYGPRDRLMTDRVFRHMSNRFIIWPGKSNPLCAPVYVTDVAECAVLAATNDKAAGQIYHVAPNGQVWFRDFCSYMIKAQGGWRLQMTIPYVTAQLGCLLMEGWQKIIRSKKMPYLTRSSVRFLNDGMNIDGTKARKELGWEQKVSMEEGCKLYVQWRQSQNGK